MEHDGTLNGTLRIVQGHRLISSLTNFASASVTVPKPCADLSLHSSTPAATQAQQDASKAHLQTPQFLEALGSLGHVQNLVNKSAVF